MSKKTVEIIIESKNHYFIQVKKNQKKLYHKIKDIFEKEITFQHNANDVFCKKEINKGRTEIRICYKVNLTTNLTTNLTNQQKDEQKDEDWKQDWKGLKTVVLIQTIVQENIKNKLTNQIYLKESLSHSYFISSQEESTEYYLELKRSHWSIEAFHYIKDITYKEDITRANKANSPQNNSYLRSLAISIYKSIGSTNQAQSIRLFANNIQELYQMIQSF